MVSPTPEPAAFYEGASYAADESIGHQLAQLMMMMRREVEARMAALDLTEAQWKPLWFLHSGRVSTANELARCTLVDAGAVTRTLDRLESKGLLVRERSAEDRRVVRLKLTAAGEAAAAGIPQVLADVNNAFLAGFSETEFRQLRKLVIRMQANGRALQSAQEPA